MIDWIRGWLQDLFVQQWLRTFGWAGGGALVVHVIGALGTTPAARAGAGAVAIALGFVAGLTTLGGVPALPPAERWQWAAWFTVGSLLLLFLEECKGGQATLRFALMMVLVGAIAWYVLDPSPVARGWNASKGRLVTFGGGIAAVLSLALAEARAPKEPAWRVLLGFTVASAGAVATMADVSEKIARGTAALGAALGVSLLVGLVQRGQTLGRTAITTATIAFGSLLLYSWTHRVVAPTGALCLLGAWSGAWLPFAPGRPGRSALATLLVSGALSAYAWHLTR